MKASSSRRAYILPASVCLAVFLVILVFTWLTPMLADDFSYCFSWADSSRITSPLQIPASMAVHRTNTNGRVVAHSLVQLVLIAPKAVFNVLNACASALLFWQMRRFFPERSPREQFLLLSLGAMLLWNLLPVFGQVVLWLDGAINYSWGVLLFLLFLRPYAASYLDLPEKRSLWRDLGFLVLALAVGAYSENGSLATLFAAACLTLLHFLRGRKPGWRPLAGLALGVLGYVFLMSAPATEGRSAGLDFSAIAKNFKLIANMTQEHLLPLFLIFGVSLALCLLLGGDRRRIIFACVLFLAGLGSLASFVFACYFAYRHFCFTVFFTVLACLILFSALLEKGRPVLPVITAGAMAVLFVFNFALGGLDIAVIHLHSRQREARIRAALEAGERSVVLETYEPATRYSAAKFLLDLNTEESRIWPNWSLADYYGLDEVIGKLPPQNPES